MIRSLLLTTSLLAITPMAAAADGTYYAKLFGGFSDLQTDTLGFGGTVTDADFDAGGVFGGAVGFDYAGSPWRAELEYSYRSSDVTPPSTVGGAGDIASTTLMVNGVYTFGAGGSWTPYAGAGIGVLTEVDLDIGSGPAAGEYEDSGVFAVQIMVGAEYTVSDRVGLFGELRYLTAGPQTLESDAGARIETDYDSLDAIVGLTIRF